VGIWICPKLTAANAYREADSILWMNGGWMLGLEKLEHSQAGKAVAIILVLGAVGVAAYMIKSAISPAALSQERERWFVDATTMEPFHHELQLGESIPVKAPSGNMSGYPAELCYWTKDGTPKTDPTPVLLNLYLGKKGPTFCPDCGRLVVPRNPPPTPGMRPPPTKDEWDREHNMVGIGPELMYSVNKAE
jgi:hypothetical protein